MKVDVGISVYGKPWQTLCTLESLIEHSGEWIDKIYFMEEAEHPFGDKVAWVMDYYENLIHYKPKKHVNPYAIPSSQVPYSNVRHQFAIDKSDKKHLFITHNDVLYTGDVIGEMLQEIEDCVAIGEVGQCWNCPAKAYGLCSGETWNDWNPTYEEIMKLPMPHIRTRANDIDKENPKLMPECRVNEWAILINRELCVKHPKPHFGDFDHDSGTEWFKAMYKRGYKFKDYRRNFKHCYFANVGGHEVEQKERLYWESEKLAEEYFKEHYEKNFE